MPRLLLTIFGTALVAGAAALWWWQSADGSAEPVPEFLARHWADPMPPQGDPPADFAPLEASLAPADCGQCHPDQYRDWRESLHAHTMGPGIQWQFALLGQTRANNCLRCHAPLAEQKALTARRMGWDGAPTADPPVYVADDLDQQGLICAACHVRRHGRFGPPATPDSLPEGSAHGGFTAHSAFSDSRFCAHCHQFPEDGPRVNGKLQEDTYAQWQASPAAAAGQQCQDCHMPGRRHLWRGIHDPEMTRRAVDWSAAADVEGERSVLVVAAHNVGAGHHFPTYMVPKVTLEAYLDRPGGQPVELGRAVIGWEVDVDLTEERFDTRIPAGERREYRFALPADLPSGSRARVVVHVHPREHYERMFRRYAGHQGLAPPVRALVREALQEAEAQPYVLTTLETPVGVGTR